MRYNSLCKWHIIMIVWVKALWAAGKKNQQMTFDIEGSIKAFVPQLMPCGSLAVSDKGMFLLVCKRGFVMEYHFVTLYMCSWTTITSVMHIKQSIVFDRAIGLCYSGQQCSAPRISCTWKNRRRDQRSLRIVSFFLPSVQMQPGFLHILVKQLDSSLVRASSVYCWWFA